MKQLLRVVLALAWTWSATMPVALGQHLIGAKEIYVDHGNYANVDNPPCRAPGQDHASELAQKLLSGSIPSVTDTVGVFVELSLPQLSTLLRGSPGELAKFLASRRYSNCGTVAIKLPPGTTASVKVYAAEGDKKYKQCTQNDKGFLKCPQPTGWSAWIWSQQGDYVVATYKNWSHNRARNGRIEVYGP